MITIDPIKRPPKKSSSVDTIMKEVDLKIADLIGEAPETLDSLKELADAVGNINVDDFVTNKTLENLLSLSKFDFVDLGLPSGLKWATCNIGANAPEEYGLYFAWGETQGYSEITESKKFTWEDYELCGDSSSTLTKYNTNSSYGTVDNLTVLEQVDDAAYQVDNTCRIPTKEELEELTANTTLTEETLNGVNGMRFASKINGNSIFVPAAGNCVNGSVRNVGSIGYLWSSSLNESYPSGACGLTFNSNGAGVGNGNGNRYGGFSVRAVQEANVSGIFDPNNYYTKSEVESMIISTLNTEV